MPLKVVFFGTPDVAVVVLDALQESAHEVCTVVTGPDRPRGRGMEVSPPPVRTRALEYGFPVMQPRSLKEQAPQAALTAVGADVFAIAAYGLILPDRVIETPRLGTVNLHFSLLPEYRGAAPIQWALIDGRDKTGVTIMQVETGLDSGPILAQIEEAIGPDDTTGSLSERLALRGAKLMIETLDRLELGQVRAEVQDDARATYAAKITPADAHIDWSSPAEVIALRVRAFDPSPGAWAILDEKRLKIWQVKALETSSDEPGILKLEEESMIVSTGTNDLRLIEVQPEGRRRLKAEEFVRGYSPISGRRLE